MKKFRVLVVLMFVLVLVSACAPAGETILTVGDKTYAKADLEKLGTAIVNYTGKDGETTTYNGVPLLAVLEDAGMKEAGQTLVFTADDGYTAEVTTDEILGCEGCSIAFDDDSLRLIMPDFSGKLQVKGLVEINTK